MKYPPAPLTPFLAALPQNARPSLRCHRLVAKTRKPRSSVSSTACPLLNSPAPLLATPPLSFQSLTASFLKTPGVGLPSRKPGERQRPSRFPRLTSHQTPVTALCLSPVLNNLQIPPAHHRPASPPFSRTYKSLFPQTLSFHIDTNPRGCAPLPAEKCARPG